MRGSALLAALQLSDSALPVGRFVHSHGLEEWVSANPGAAPEQLGELVDSMVCLGVAPLDGVFVAHAHRAGTLAELLGLDRALTVRKPTPPARAVSLACGRQLAALAPSLAPDADGLVGAMVEAVADRRTDGNLAVVGGVLARSVGLAPGEAVLLELRGTAAALLSAAVRLGAVAPTRAQALLAQLHPSLERAAEAALAAEIADAHSSALALELHALTHRRADARLFAT